MPGWSAEIANEFIEMAVEDQRPLTQMQLQDLVYIAHGWCLAIHGQPLTGDRPEAMPYGPEYRRLAEALAPYGVDEVSHLIIRCHVYPEIVASESHEPARAELENFELKLIDRVYRAYSSLPASRLANVTRAPGAPWDHVFAGGAGRTRDISHDRIRAQFAELARHAGNIHFEAPESS